MSKALAIGLIVGLSAAACGDGAGTKAADAAAVPDSAIRECRSNPDCGSPRPICDMVRGECVECLETSHCAHLPDTTCNYGACTCTGEDSYCEGIGCVALDTDPANCGRCNHACYGACAEGACVHPWEPVSASGAPAARARHVAVWTGSEMIVWGGASAPSLGASLSTGGVYDLATSTWLATTPVGAPGARQYASAVWTGDKMIVWGGVDASNYFDDGAAYDPATDTWTPISSTGAPSGRIFHTAVWSGSEMIVWGGRDATGEQLDTGGRYDPIADTWTPFAAAPGSETRMLHSAVWTGSEMWIYGGIGDAGANLDIYLPGAAVPGGRSYAPPGTWAALPAVGQPSARARHTAVWTGSAMLVFGGTDGAVDLNNGFSLTDAGWTALPGPAPGGRYSHTATWLETSELMFVWGGRDSTAGALGTGGVYDAQAGAWLDAPQVVLTPRHGHTAVSTGDSAIIWGGFDASDQALGDGAIYTP